MAAPISAASVAQPPIVTLPRQPARAAQPADAAPWPLLSALPGAVDAAAVLDRPADLLYTDPAGQSARALIARTGMFAQTQRAWAGLSEALGYTQEEAARALLGGRVVIAWAGLTDDDGTGPVGAAARADTRWIVIAEIDRATADAVRTRLRPAPRRTLDGRVIYSIDAGRTAMALLEADDRAQSGPRTRVLIAPNQGIGLLETVLNSGQPPAANPLGDRARAVLGNTRAGWAAIAAVRLPESPDPTVIEFRTAGPAWGVRFATPSDHAPPNGAPVGVLAHIASNALLAAAFAEGPRFGPAGLDLRIRLQTSPVEPDGSDDARGEPLELRRGAVLALHRVQANPENPALPAATPAMIGQVITHASATDDTPFAERADRLMSDMIGGDHPPAHRGRFPDAVRTHTIEPDTDRQRHPSAWPGDHARVAWSIAPETASPNGAGDDVPRAGVLAMAFGPRGSDPAPAARAGRDAWTAGQADADPTMLAAGYARPAELVEILALPASSPLLTLAASIDRLEWTVRLRDGLARGEILLRIHDNPARLGSP